MTERIIMRLIDDNGESNFSDDSQGRYASSTDARPDLIMSPRSPSAPSIASLRYSSPLERKPPTCAPRALADAMRRLISCRSFSAGPHWPALQDWPRKSGYQTFDALRLVAVGFKDLLAREKAVGGQWGPSGHCWTPHSVLAEISARRFAEGEVMECPAAKA